MVDLCNYVPLLGQPFRWNNQADRLSYGFQCRVAEQQPGGQIKSPQPILAVGNINNGRHVLECALNVWICQASDTKYNQNF